MSYNNVFNGNFVQPSSVSYKNIELTSDITLSWPTSYLDNSTDTVLASNMTVQADADGPIITALGADPITTVDGESVVTVTVDSTEDLIVGTPITISGATDTNGILAAQLNITANILGIAGGTSFTYTSNGTANADGAGGGNAVELTYFIPYVILLPDATQVSPGESVRFINNGNNSFIIADNSQNFLVTLAVGNVYDLLLTDNSTAGGEWEVLEAGTGTASSNASALAGLGLTAINGSINADFQSKSIAGDYTAILSDRASLLVWTGGVGTITLPVVGTIAPKGYNVSVNNEGGGIVTLTTSDGSTIDGAATFTLSPGESCQFILTDPNWNTLGFGTETFFAVNTLSLSIAAGGTINLTSSQSSRLVQTYTGALAQNAVITFPAAAGQWYVWNNTTNAHTVTLQLFGVGGGFVIPQGEKLIVYSDGNNLYFAPTTATNAIFNPGTEGGPTIVFTNDATTGFYSAAAGDFGFSSGGTLSVTLADYGLGVNAGGEVVFFNAANTFYASLTAGNMTSNVIWTLPLLDATVAGQLLYSDASETLAFTTASYPLTTTAHQLLYSSATNSVTGLASANNGVLVTSAGGVPSISSTIPAATQDNITRLGTIVTGTWNATPVTVPYGGTGLATLTTAYGVVCAGTTATGALQNTGAGTLNQVLTSNGAAALPTWKSINISLPAAVKADQITGTSTAVYVNPAVQQFHASAAKVWAQFNGILTTPITPTVGYNVTSITKYDQGQFIVNVTTAFTSINYSVSGSCGNPAALTPSFVNSPYGVANTTTSFNVASIIALLSGSGDFSVISIQAFGTQ